MAYSALFISQSHGLIEMHFHIFGALAFLLVYRDWRVIVIAAGVDRRAPSRLHGAAGRGAPASGSCRTTHLTPRHGAPARRLRRLRDRRAGHPARSMETETLAAAAAARRRRRRARPARRCWPTALERRDLSRQRAAPATAPPRSCAPASARSPRWSRRSSPTALEITADLAARSPPPPSTPSAPARRSPSAVNMRRLRHRAAGPARAWRPATPPVRPPPPSSAPCTPPRPPPRPPRAALTDAERGMGTADDARAAMSAVEESAAAITDASDALVRRSAEITGFVGTITTIAEQTNLLALERRDRGRPRRRERPGLRRRRRRGPQARRAVRRGRRLDQRDRQRHRPHDRARRRPGRRRRLAHRDLRPHRRAARAASSRASPPRAREVAARVDAITGASARPRSTPRTPAGA